LVDDSRLAWPSADRSHCYRPLRINAMTIADNLGAATRDGLDATIARLRRGAETFTGLSVDQRIALAQSMLEGYGRVSAQTAVAAASAKGGRPGSRIEAEEWVLGPYFVLRGLRATKNALAEIARTGTTRVGAIGRTVDGRTAVQIFPLARSDGVFFPRVAAELHLQPGIEPDDLARTRARYYREPARRPAVVLVLGAGNVNAIGPLDCVSKLFNEGKVCLLKMHPVNAYLGPFIEDAFADAIQAGFLAVAYGGAEVGAYLAQHPGVDEVHITGSARTHDAIVWGADRERRVRALDPALKKPITSELGNISPVIVVPGPYSTSDLAYQADAVAGALVNNAGSNCNAAAMLITSSRWAQRQQFLDALGAMLSRVPTRRGHYPGAAERWQARTADRSVKTFGERSDDVLPWALVTGLRAADTDERSFTDEAFCSVLSETPLDVEEPTAFLDAAVEFANERLWGTLVATVIVHPRTVADRRSSAAVERAIARLRYGTVGLNIWGAYGFALGTTSWGGHPGATLQNVESGIGFVHNSQMVEGIEKCVLRSPFRVRPKPSSHASFGSLLELGRQLSEFEADRSPRAFLGAVAAGMRG